MNDEEAHQAILNAAVQRVMHEMLANPAPKSPEPTDLVLLVRRKTPLAIDVTVPDGGVHQVCVLEDGSTLIRTTFDAACRAHVEVLLAEWHTNWVDEHDDERGVPSFVAEWLQSAMEATSYEASLSSARDVVFLRPRWLQAL
jgi:hypothetical protein